MLCQQCGKNEAVMHIIRSINGGKNEMLLCSECAGVSPLSISPISFSNFLHGFIDISGSMGGFSEANELTCPKCGISLKSIKKLGKAGCDRCYDVFKTQIETIIKKVQASSCHTGKCPKNARHLYVQREINALKNDLSIAVANEEFEEAARLRDSIKALKGDKSHG